MLNSLLQRICQRKLLQSFLSTVVAQHPQLQQLTTTSTCRLFDIGKSDYETAWRYQRSMVECHLNTKYTNDTVLDCLIITEHHSVYTLGKGSTLNNLKHGITDDSYESVIRIERGGEVTWHGPGMLMLYPVRDESPIIH